MLDYPEQSMMMGIAAALKSFRPVGGHSVCRLAVAGATPQLHGHDLRDLGCKARDEILFGIV
ncbi:hypothetical protein NKI79_22675 [Mesorhizobium sp. M0340]|uniref:hypothetical protein n=2 Tax=Mesorhizobium TaxID=68287 RepID=UPI003339B80C